MKRVLTFLLLTLSLFTYANDLDKTFLDENFNPLEDMSGAKYYRTVTQESNLFYAEVYYLTDAPQMKGNYLDSALTILHGTCQYFHRNGKIESTGRYENGVRVGLWKRYSLFGEKKTSRYYATPTEIDKQFKLKTSLASFNYQGETLEDYVKDNLEWPVQASFLDLTEGTVVINLNLTSEGQITSYEILSCSDYCFKPEAKKLVANMPNWSPALSRGNAVSSNFIIKIEFNQDTKKTLSAHSAEK